MRGFLAALGFLTVVPAFTRKSGEDDLPSSVAYFPLVGLLIGAILVAIYGMGGFLGLNDMALNGIVVVALALVTGGLHLDGLADTFDAVGSGKPKDEMLKIMRDPHIGAIGTIALVSALLLKLSFLSCLSGSGKAASVVLMCVLGRWSMAVVMQAFPYARSEGKVKAFIKDAVPRAAVYATLIALAIAALMGGLRCASLLLPVGLFAYLFAGFVAGKVGGMTGDVLGAVNELTEIFTLFLTCVVSGGAI